MIRKLLSVVLLGLAAACGSTRQTPAPSTVAAQARLEPAPAPDLPPFTGPREVRTVYANGGWAFWNGERTDNIGDFTIAVSLYGDRRVYVCMARMGGAPPAGSFWWAPYGDIYGGWTQGGEPGSRPNPIKSIPKPLGTINIDTHAEVENPLTGVTTWIHGVRMPNGIYHLERATSSTIDPKPEAFTRFAETFVAAPAEECSYVINPWLGVAHLFYVRKTQTKADAYGETFRSLLYRREVSLRNFDTKPELGPEELVWDPAEDGQGPWGTCHTVIQPGICILPDHTYLMAALGKTPYRSATGKPLVGKQNATCAVGLWRSTTEGRSWVPFEGNPVFSRELLGLPDGFANQINSPHPLFDPWSRKLYVAMAINRRQNVNKPGTILVIFETQL